MPESGIFSAGRAMRRSSTLPSFLTPTSSNWLVRSPFFTKLVKNQCEKLPLEVEIQTEGSVDAHEPCMQTHVRVFSSGSRFARRPAKVDAVVGNKCPVAFEDDPLEFPVLRACLSEVIDMRTEKAPLLGVGGQRRAQVFIDQYFLQTPSLLVRSYEVASWKWRP